MANTTSLIIKPPGANFGGAGVPLYRDPLQNSGSLLLFDFSDLVCFPAQAAPAGGATLINLVSGGASASVTGSSITFSGGGLVLPGNSSNYLDLGSGYDLNALGSPSFLAIIWIKQDGSLTSSFQGVYGRSTNTSTQNQWFIDSGSGGQTPRANVGNGTVSGNVSFGASTANAVEQLCFFWNSASGIVTAYKNGVQVGTSGAVAGPLEASPPGNTRIGYGSSGASYPAFKGNVYRAYLENITTSATAAGLTASAMAAAQVAADYAANSTRFS